MARLRTTCSDAVRSLRTVAAPALLAATLHLPSTATADEAQDLKASIVVRCFYASGEFGHQLVDICVKEDLAAAQALQEYPPESSPVIDGCTRRLQGDGWARVRICVDDDLAAGTALFALDAHHAPLIAQCRSKVGGRGAAQVLACVNKGTGSGSID